MPTGKKSTTRSTSTRGRAQKKTTPVKKTPKKAAASKRTSAKKKTTTTPKKTVKTAVKKSPKKLKPVKKETLTKNTGFNLPHTVSLSILNPFRLPVNPDQLAIGTARFAGAFFVVVGGIFAFLNLAVLTGGFMTLSVSNMAVVCDPQIDPYCDPNATSNDAPSSEMDAESGCYLDDPVCLDEFYSSQQTTQTHETTSTTESTAIDPTPDVLYKVHATEPLLGLVYVSIFVDNANEVELHAFEKGVEDVFIAYADQVSDQEWKVAWRTSEFADGDYKFRAIVRNEFGVYDQIDTKYYQIENTVSDGDGSASTTTTTTSSDTTTDTTAVGTPEPAIDESHYMDMKGTVTIQIDVEAAEEITIDLYNTDLKKRYTLGNATRIDSNTWKRQFDSKKYPDGPYRIDMHIKNADGTYTRQIPASIKNSIITEETTDPVLVDETTDAATEDAVLKPEVKLTVRASSPISGAVDVRIDTESAQFVEIYVIGKYSLIEQFLGLASKVDVGRWNYRWNTVNTPNGEYAVVAKVRNSFGTYSGDPVATKVFNEVVMSTVKTTTLTENQVATAEEEAAEEVSQEEKAIVTFGESLNEQDENIVEDQGAEDVVTVKASEILADFKDEIDEELQRLQSAIRSGDEEGIRRVKDRLAALRDRILQSVLEDAAVADLTEELDKRIRDQFARLESDTERTEEILRERTGDEIQKDSDDDGITDYDEINIYLTDPLVADSDGDGFIDGAEILSGFNPKDARAEAFVAYESPKESGVTRSDILEVVTVQTASTSERDVEETGNNSQALISGRALPNSFVTLYIFSTPIVVTVKTDDEGSWVYRFDKELEDGEHEVYAAVTDNAGKVVAKSQSFRFVKTAEAFTPAEAAASTKLLQDETINTFPLKNALLIVLSVVVVAVGLILIMLGMHLSGRREELSASESPALPPVV